VTRAKFQTPQTNTLVIVTNISEKLKLEKKKTKKKTNKPYKYSMLQNFILQHNDKMCVLEQLFTKSDHNITAARS